MNFKLGIQHFRPPGIILILSVARPAPHPERPLNYFDLCFNTILVIGSDLLCFLLMRRKTTLRSFIAIEGSSAKVHST
jgi:hypothetical protein